MPDPLERFVRERDVAPDLKLARFVRAHWHDLVRAAIPRSAELAGGLLAALGVTREQLEAELRVRAEREAAQDAAGKGDVATTSDVAATDETRKDGES